MAFKSIPGGKLLLVAALVVLVVLARGEATRVDAAPCDPPVTNPIVCENSKPGNPPSEWDITGAGDPSIQGYATEISVNKGETIRFKVDTDATDYRIDVYRLGYYGGQGARKVATVQPSASLPQIQPSCLSEPSTGLVDCGNWAISASWAVPADAVSGIYIGKLVRESGPEGASHIYFVVRDDDGHSPLLFQTSDTTWQAYNRYGGTSLYAGPNGRGVKVSYNRPFTTRQGQCCIGSVQSFLFSAEYPMVRFLERNGYNVSYFTGVDSDRRGHEILEHKVFMSVGHDEYWSANQRANVEAARDAGVHLAFFSGNEVFWKVRWEASIDGSGTPYRTLVTYKETSADAKVDPSPEWTGTWRDPRFSPPADGGRPENALTGTIFMVNGPSQNHSILVPAEEGKLRFWRNTSIAELPPDGVAVLPKGVLGFEWDEDQDNGFRPAGLVRLSKTTVPVGTYLLDYGDTFGGGVATHRLTFYRASSGALVFGAGTIQWSWGLDPVHDKVPGLDSPSHPDVRMQQATVNLLADMGVQPDTLGPGLTPASASTDTTPPTAVITSPTTGATVNGQTTVSGTASDTGGGRVGGVEISLDNGQTWHPADGRENWSYTWSPAAIGEYTIRVRAVDDSGNIGPVSPAITVTATAAVASFDDLIPGRPLDGQYPTGQIDWGQGQWFISPPVGSFPTPSISFVESLTQAELTFIVPRRFVAIDAHNFGEEPATVTISCAGNPDKVAVVPPAETVTITTGWVGGCTTASIATSNGWETNFDNLVYDDAGIPPDETPPVISGVQAASNGTGVTITWTTDENANSQVEYGTTASYGSSTPLDTSLTQNHSVTISGLTLGQTYHYRVKSTDAWSNPAASQDFTFTADCPCTLFGPSATPQVQSAPDTVSLEVGVKFTSDVNGYVSGIRFYKGPTNTGTHVAHLWTASGQMLASATFSGETPSGWQQVNFASPVPVSANTTYVASYHAPNGGFAYSRPFFSAPHHAAPLHAPVDAGVFHWGSSGFPGQTFQSSNYWVDIVFTTSPLDSVAPVVETHSPASGATGVSPSAPLTATFSEPIDPASLTFELRASDNSLVQATLSYDAASRTATLQPQAILALTAPYTASVSGARDMAGNVMQPLSWQFTTAGASANIWSSERTPAIASQSDTSAVELGVKFRSAIDGYIRGVRFYKGPANTGTHTGSLWTEAGQLLATATFTNETATGWQEVLFSAPVAIQANATYVASYHAPNGGYSVDQNFFAAAGDGQWPLTALGEGVDGSNGLFRYGPSAFPDQSYRSTNYWVDVVFSTSAVDDVPPGITTHTPANGASKVAPEANVSVTFSEDVVPGTISFVLKDSGGATVPASLAYDAPSRTATLNPNSDLPLGGSFRATVSGAQDAAGNAMQPFSWQFATPACPCGLWDSAATPALAAQNDSSAVEVGVKFSSQIAGYVTGIRFYKGPGNTGTHTGSLWTANGDLLARAVFTGETASGWQQVTFAAPVAIQPNTTYVASYHAPNGHYALDEAYFTQAHSSWPLVAPAAGASGGNGVFTYSSSPAFPINSYNGSNYWVDVTFATTAQDGIAPNLAARTPAPDATDVAPGVSVTATFNEDIDAQTLSFVLRDEDNSVVPADVSYDATTRKAALEPDDYLALGVTFTATISAKDEAGNQMLPVSWSFTTQGCPCSLLDSSATPAIASQDDTQAIEVGVKFTSAVDGFVTGVRFYKGPANTGTHVAHLWSATGQLLATATFGNETASGWQEVSFAAPVAIEAGETYVASYHAPNGGYSRDVNYFSQPREVYPLTALASSNGVFAYGPAGTFPSNSFSATNYWVDVVFETEP